MDAIKSSAYSSLAADLEINKAMVLLHNRETQLAIDTLKMFENRDSKVVSSASTMLSFIYFLVRIKTSFKKRLFKYNLRLRPFKIRQTNFKSQKIVFD